MAKRKSLGALMDSKNPAQNASSPLNVENFGNTFYNWQTITPRRVKWILQMAENRGRVDFLYKLYDDMEVSDTRYAGLINQIKSTIGGMPIRIIEAEGRTEREQELASEYAEYANAVLESVDKKSLLKEFVEPYMRGAQLFKVNWELDDLPYNRKMYMPSLVRRVDGRHLFEETNWGDEHFGELKVRLEDGPYGTAISELPFDNHLLVTDGDNHERHAKAGVARRVLPWFVALRFVQTWWIQYVENYGSPLRVGKYPRGASKNDRMKMQDFLQKLGQNGYGLFPNGMEVQLMDASKQGQVNTYKDFMRYGHTEYGVLILGQASTTGDDPEGSYAKSVTMNGIRNDILKDVAEISGKGFRDLVKKGLRLNYGDDYDKRLCPHIRPILLDSTNAKERAQAAQIVSRQLGVAIPQAHIYENILGTEKPRRGQVAYLNGQKFVYGEDPEPEPMAENSGLETANPAATEDKENDSVNQGETSEANGGAN